MKQRVLGSLAVLALGACSEPPTPAVFDIAPVEHRDIAVSVEAAGVIEPETTVEVKSKASGEILEVRAETGDTVVEGTLLVQIDKRTPRNRFAQAESGLKAAHARRAIAQSQTNRARTLHESATITDTEYEQTVLEFANAEAQVVGAEVEVENARIALEDTEIRAPIDGTIIEKHVEKGQVISSPTQDVGGGTLLMKMADLSTVLVRTLVDETDIGKIRARMPARVTVAAYPNQPFDGEVLKIEPQAIVDQNVTMFAVLIRLQNPQGLLKPGMNAEVEISIAERHGVLAVPTMALRTERDIESTAAMLGMSLETLRAQLAAQAGPAELPAPATKPAAARDGFGPQTLSAIRTKREGGEPLGAEEQALIGQMRHGRGQGGEGDFPASGRPRSVTNYEFGADYWVVLEERSGLRAVRVRTGLTDLGHSEVIAGLNPDDRVYLLPSTSLYENQERIQNRLNRRFGGIPGLSRQTD